MAERKTNKKYTREAILRSPRFSGYQPDFLAAILKKTQYTIAEAEESVKAFFKKESD